MKKQKGVMKRVGVKLLVAAMIMSYGVAPSMTVKASETTLKNPIIVEDFSLACEKRVTYDCIYFGSYPQAEVVASEVDEITICDKIRNGNDYIVDSETYNKLCDAAEWDEAGDITLSDGSRYRRLSKAEAKDYYNNQYSRTQDNYFNWSENPGYHYFKYQPIKWRVLSTDGNKAFLLASIALDYQRCDETHTGIYWKDSTIRSFLNSYDASMNTSAIDYTKKGFYNVAFSEMEKMAILTTNGISDYNQQENLNGTGIRDEDNDEENYYPSGKIFLLDDNEIFCALPRNNIGLFAGDGWNPSEAICMKSTTYAKANGCWSSIDDREQNNEVGNCRWWLSGPVMGGEMSCVISEGYLIDGSEGGGNSCNQLNAIVPTLTLDLSQYQPSYAGTVCNNGTIIDENGKDISLPEYYHIHYFPMYGVHSNGIVTKVATCKSEGIKSYKCGNCDLTREETTSKDPLNHIGGTVVQNVINATDTKDGYTGDTYCKSCGVKLASGKRILAKQSTYKLNTDLKNPIVTKDASMKAGQRVTYDYLYFGSYPQSEVIRNNSQILDNWYQNGNGYIVDAITYDKLTRATWTNNETVINGDKYRRMTRKDAVRSYVGEYPDNNSYKWSSDENEYRYFKYEPIKWRILSTDGMDVFLLSELIVDNQRYHEKQCNITWENSSIRSFLNNSFYQTAFSSTEQKVINTTNVINNNNMHDNTNAGSDTKDKIFLLSEQEVRGVEGFTYGFANAYEDETKQAKGSIYAKAMGCYMGDYGEWWLRTPYGSMSDASRVSSIGSVTGSYEDDVYDDYVGVRPALKLNLTDGNLCIKNGVVSVNNNSNTTSNSTVNNTNNNNNNQTTVINKELKTQTITIAKIKSYKASKLKKKKATIKLNAKTTGNGKITYSVTKYPKKAKKYISVTKKGVVTLKKGAKKGTYKITIKAAKTSEYKEAKKVVTIKVK